jgi:hypothetical protein
MPDAAECLIKQRRHAGELGARSEFPICRLCNAGELTAGFAGGLDLHQQVLAANVCL